MKLSDLVALKEWFAAYCTSYYSLSAEDNRNMLLKEEHTHCVCDNMELLTASLGLDDEDHTLAICIALFHDVGRFEQYRRFKTFKDSDSINHAVLGAQVLAERGVLGALSQEERTIVLRAVTLHNVFIVPPGLDERLSLHVRLIRDADKLDIWRIFIDYYGKPEAERASAVGLGFPDLPFCSAEVLREVSAGRMVNLSLLKTLNDFKLLQMSWVFDLNFPVSFKLLMERDYIRQLAETIPVTEDVTLCATMIGSYVARHSAGAIG